MVPPRWTIVNHLWEVGRVESRVPHGGIQRRWQNDPPTRVAKSHTNTDTLRWKHGDRGYGRGAKRHRLVTAAVLVAAMTTEHAEGVTRYINDWHIILIFCLCQPLDGASWREFQARFSLELYVLPARRQA